ncbi:hypothetical protein THAOC_24128, partial [Thalassiosira oceanica]
MADATSGQEAPKESGAATQLQWQLPDGIESHIEAFLIKSAIGASVGGAVGGLAMRSPVAGAVFGVGCALGSFVERVRAGDGVDPAVPRFDFTLPDLSFG